jgi:hypothetical protein
VLELLRLGADKTIEGFSKTRGETGGKAGMASLTTAAQARAAAPADRARGCRGRPRQREA